MKKLIIITGANKGLGKAFFDEFISMNDDLIIISISRKLSDYQNQLITEGSKKFEFINLDLSNLKNTSDLKAINKYAENIDKVIFINNAGSVDPIGQIGNLEDENLISAINVNVVSPSLIINYIIKTFASKKIDIINISSGAATNIIEGWATYCGCKAYMHMFIQSLEVQAKSNKLIKVYNISPGVIDTDMQKQIRDASGEGFVRQKEFIAYKTDGKLQDPKEVAKNIIQQTGILL